MPFNILKNAVIRNDLSCRHDNRDGYSVIWDKDDNFKQYTEFESITSRVVWEGRYTAVSTSGTCFIGPSTDQVPVDAGIYNLVNVNFRLEIPEGREPPTVGKIQFQTADDPIYDEDKTLEFSVSADNAYNEYIVDMSQKKEWSGEVTRVRIHPFLDGFAGIIVHFKHLKLQSSSVFTCDTIFNTPLCSRYFEYSHPCPWVGAGGSCTSAVVGDGITITEGVNDKLIVDINDYGEQGITLKPTIGARLKDIALDIEEKLSNVGIGGYSGVKVSVSSGKLIITADDTREAASTVIVSNTAAARTLGFFNSSGTSTSVLEPGEDAASRYEPMGTIQMSKGDIAHFYTPDPNFEKAGIVFDTERYAVEAGRNDFAITHKDQKIDFSNQTIIDFNNPITNNGTISYVAYSGDGNISTEIRFFRPKSDGSITHTASVPMGITSEGLLDKVFEATASIKVRKGDYIGIYNGRLDAGKTEEFPNSSYFIYDGNFTGNATIEIPEIVGRGEKGLRLYARGEDKADKAVIRVDFDFLEPIEEITVFAAEEERVETINLTRVLAGGTNGGPFITGETGEDKFGSQAPSLTGLGSLIDRVKYNSPSASTTRPSWLDGTIEPPDKFDRTSFNIAMDFAKGVPVFFDIYKVVLYFRDAHNVKFFAVEYPITTDEFDNDKYWGVVADKYEKVFLEDRLLLPNDHPLYNNPIVPRAEDFLISYQNLEFRKIALEFEPVRARSIRYNVDNFSRESDVLKSTYSDYELAPSARILEMEVFAKSVPSSSIADNFVFESSTDGLNYRLHTDVDTSGAFSSKYLIGYPVSSLRVSISPKGKLTVRAFEASLSEGALLIKTNSKDATLNMGLSYKDSTSFQKIRITNDSDSPFNYFIDISPQKNIPERCILWNKLGSEEELSVSELGPSSALKKRDIFYLREYNYSLNVPAYVVDPLWLLNKNTKSYVSLDGGSSWQSRGTTISDYNENTFIISENTQASQFTFFYVLLDLGTNYVIDTIEAVNTSINPDFFNLTYSNKNVSDPNLLNIIDDFTGVKEDARWIRLVGFSRLPGDTINKPNKINYFRISLNAGHSRNTGKIPWVSAPKLTNYKFGSNNDQCGEGWQKEISGFNNYYAVDLEGSYKITNVVAGPVNSGGFSSTPDIDNILPGATGSLFTSSSDHSSNLAFSNSLTSDVSKVRWGSFNQSPGAASRWILLKRLSNIYDEVLVHVEDNIQENKVAFPNKRWWTSNFCEIRKDTNTFNEQLHSIAFDYPANRGPDLEELLFEQSMGIDHDLARRDFLRALIYISDVSQLDTAKGYLSIGRYTTEDNSGLDPLEGTEIDEENYYKWNLSDFTETPLVSGWNDLLFPFSDNFKVGEPFFTKDNPNNFSFGDISGRSRFRWFKLAFAGKENNSAFTVNIESLRIERGRFLPAKWGNGVYLSGNEYLKFPVNNFNPFKGTIEFWLNTDWSKTPGCMTCEDFREHTIFRIFNQDKYTLGAFMTGFGLRIYLTDGTKQYILTDNSDKSIFLGQNNHVAVVWDLKGENSEWALAVYINNVLSSTFEAEALFDSDFNYSTTATLLIGGIGWEGIINRLASSVDGVIDNIKLYNYPMYDFTHSMNNEDLENIRTSDELIEISTNGINYFGAEDRGNGLPIYVSSVQPGTYFDVYVRNRPVLSEIAFLGQGRNSYLEIIKSKV